MARYKFQGTARDGNGRVIPECAVTVYESGGTTPATCYEAETGGTAIPNSLITADSSGGFAFWVDDTDYTEADNFKITLSKTGFNSKSWDDIKIIQCITDQYMRADAASDFLAVANNLSEVNKITALGNLGVPMFFVKNYGVVGDGTTDDTAAFQAAIDAAVANGGGEVIIPAGTYNIESSITLNSAMPISIRGSGRRKTVLSAGSNFAGILSLGASSYGLQMHDVLFATGSTTTPGLTIANGAADHAFYDCKWTGAAAGLSLCYSEASGFIEWHNCHFVANNATCVGLELDSNNQVWRLINCRFSGVGLGFKVSGTSNNVQGGRAIGTHWVNTGTWAVNLGPSFDTVFDSCTMDQLSVSCVIVGTNADRVTFTGNFFGAPGGNISAKLVDINADSGNQMTFVGNTFYGGAVGIQARATASAGEYLDGLQVIGNKYLNQYSAGLQLDSVMKATIIGNVDKGTPANGSWITSSTNSVNGQYVLDDNHWHTRSPNVFSTSAEYKWGRDTGIVMYNRGSVSASSRTAITTAHGLSRTPSWCQGTPTIRVGNWWNNAKDATNISFTWVTSGSPTWHWEVEV